MIIPIENLVLLPGMTCTIRLNGQKLLKENLSDHDPVIALPTKNHPEGRMPEPDDFYRVGVAVEILEVNSGEQEQHVLVKTVNRVEVSDIVIANGKIDGKVTPIPDVIDLDANSRKQMISYIRNIAHQVGAKFRNSEQILKAIDEIDDLNILIGSICQLMPLTGEEQYSLMATSSLKNRVLTFIDYFLRYKESIKLQLEMSERFNEKTSKNYRDAILREQLKAIQDELGKDGSQAGSVPGGKNYRDLIDKAHMPDEIRQTALEELEKLESQNPASPDYNVIRDYLDLLVALPWEVKKEKPVSLEEARRMLDQQHYGLEKVKKRVLQHIAVMQLKGNKQGSILLLVGPPGAGKTSLGKSIAQALNRKYVRVSLGGIRDEAEIRGHRQTYVGAMPGRIIEGIKKAGVMNPVMVLDEVDKLMTGYNGDPAAALLEVLTRNRTALLPTITSTCLTTFPTCSLLRRPTRLKPYRRLCWTAWKSLSFPAIPRMRSSILRGIICFPKCWKRAASRMKIW